MPFHQAAVAHEDVGVVVDQIVAELGVQDALGERHADRVGDALAERAGGGLDAVGMVDIRDGPAVLLPIWRKCLISSIVMSL